MRDCPCVGKFEVLIVQLVGSTGPEDRVWRLGRKMLGILLLAAAGSSRRGQRDLRQGVGGIKLHKAAAWEKAL